MISARVMRRGRPFTERVARQVPFATALALTRVAQDIEKEQVRMMRRVLSNPRPYTLRAMAVRPATKSTLKSEVFFREFAGKGVAAGKYLRHMETGGPRRPKRSELALRRTGVLRSGELLRPIPGGPFDGNGAGLGGRYTRLLSAMRANPDALSNTTAASTKLANRRGRRRATYFKRGTQIWERTGKRKARPVLQIISRTGYRPELRFEETGRKMTRERMDRQFDLALRQALATAR